MLDVWLHSSLIYLLAYCHAISHEFDPENFQLPRHFRRSIFLQQHIKFAWNSNEIRNKVDKTNFFFPIAFSHSGKKRDILQSTDSVEDLARKKKTKLEKKNTKYKKLMSIMRLKNSHPGTRTALLWRKRQTQKCEVFKIMSLNFLYTSSSRSRATLFLSILLYVKEDYSQIRNA